MKIIFNLLGTGLGNNGGSKTLIRSAETLQELGEEVYISCQASSCTWWKIGVPVINKLVPCDVLIATGYGSVKSTINYGQAKLKLWYVRAHENWRADDAHLMKGYRSLRCIANSEWIKAWLATFNIDCELVYPGIDFECYSNFGVSREDIMGGLQHKHKRKRPQDCLKVHQISKYPMLMLNRDISTGDFAQLSDFYNKIKVWMSPSENEGLQNVPVEAALCGCGLVLTDDFMGGTADYAKHEETCLLYPARDLAAAAECVDRLMKDEELRVRLNENAVEVIRSQIGDRRHNMEKFIIFLRENI